MVICDDELKRLFLEERMTYDELAENFDCGRSTVGRHLRDMGISEANRPARFRTDPKGYEVLASSTDQIYHHRLLMVALTGLTDLSDYHIHHINGLKWDNRPENIEIVDRESHLQNAHEKAQ